MSAGSAPSAATTDYAVVQADLQADRPRVLALWASYMKRSPEAKYQWFYLGREVQSPLLLRLTHGPQGDTVGVGGLGPRTMHAQGAVCGAGILADLVVHTEHRTLYPALLLQKQMRQLALQRYRIVYGAPNKNSTPIVKRLGYTKVGDIVRYSNVLHCRSYLERRLPRWLSAALAPLVDRLMPLYFRPYRLLLDRWDTAWVSAPDARFDALWSQARGFDGIIGTRDAAYLSWRFTQEPQRRHRFFTVTRSGSETLTAYAVCEADGATLHVRDILADPSRDDHLRLALYLLSREAYREGFANLSLEFLGPRRLHDLLVGAGLVERDKRPLYASFAADDDARLRALDWYVTCADED